MSAGPESGEHFICPGIIGLNEVLVEGDQMSVLLDFGNVRSPGQNRQVIDAAGSADQDTIVWFRNEVASHSIQATPR